MEVGKHPLLDILLLLHADDIVLIVDSLEEMLRHLEALHAFTNERDLFVNLSKITIMIFTVLLSGF